MTTRVLLLDALKRADHVRRRIELGVAAFQSRYEGDLATYRSQRAWRAMLAVRKAYALLFSKGFRGRLECARWLLQAPFRGLTGLDEYEPAFPDLGPYLPPEYRLPFTGDAQQPLPSARFPKASAGLWDAIFLPIFEFDFRFQRPQQLATHFARAGHRVFWISPSRTATSDSFKTVQLSENLWEIHLRHAIPNIYTGSLTAHADNVLEDLEELFHEADICANAAIVQFPSWRPVAMALRARFASKVVFDCMDHWATFPGVSDFAREQQPELVREADAVVATARELAREIREQRQDAALIPNGADFELFSRGRARGLLRQFQKPVIGYFGAIADWFDYDLLETAARLRPDYSFVLIGSYGMEKKVDGEHVAALKRLPNVHLLGHKEYSELPGYVAEFDACIIPFVLNDVTKATDPVKLYEYLSQGKPVVSTPLHELRQYEDLVYLAASPAEFAAALDKAVNECAPERVERRMEFSRVNTWKKRYEAFSNVVSAVFDRISILIVTYNSEEFLPACLDSIRENTAYPNYEVVVVDNNSSDGSVSILRRFAAADERIRVIESRVNLGFAGGNNLAARNATGQHLILLNADTMVTTGWMERLARHWNRDRTIAIINPVTNFSGNETAVEFDYWNASEMNHFAASLAWENAGKEYPLTVAPLFCAFVPKAVWDEAGGLDERYERGMFEDDDFSLAVRRAGRRIVAAEDCFVHHFGQGSFGKLATAEYQEIFSKNRERFEQKWKTPWTPHRYRDGFQMKPVRFIPSEFVKDA